MLNSGWQLEQIRSCERIYHRSKATATHQEKVGIAVANGLLLGFAEV